MTDGAVSSWTLTSENCTRLLYSFDLGTFMFPQVAPGSGSSKKPQIGFEEFDNLAVIAVGSRQNLEIDCRLTL